MTARLTSLLLLIAIATAACSDEPPGTTGSSGPSRPSAASSAPMNTESALPGEPAAPGRSIELLIDGAVRLTAELIDGAAADDLLAQLPLTVTMSDFGSMEKVGELPASLSTAGAPSGADPAVGDLGYYAPWNNLVLYYGEQGYHEGILRLGTLDGDIDALADLDGDVTVQFRRLVAE